MQFRSKYSIFHSLSLIFIVCIAIFLRFYELGEIPVALNRDEASLGYTAYSILYTGADEHGNQFPINIQSFGDWKLPLYVYVTIPSIMTFGLSEWSVRLPSAMAGVAIVLLGYILSRLLIEKDVENDKKKYLPLVVSFLLAVSPWSVHISRIAYEAHLSLAFFLLGLVFFFMADQRSFSKQPWMKKYLVWLYPFAALCFGLTLFGYHSFQIFTPLIGLFLIWRYFNEVKNLLKDNKVVFLLSAAIVLFCGIVLIANKSGEANTTKFTHISIFSHSLYTDELFLKRQLVGEIHPLLAKIYANQIGLYITKLMQNIGTLWNPTFLFISGGTHGSHNLSLVGNMYLIEFISVLIGFLLFVKERKSWQMFIFIWLAIATVAPIITIEPNHSIRFLPALFPLIVISGYGMLKLAEKNISAVFFLLLFYQMFQFTITYFIIFPVKDLNHWPWYMEEIARTIQAESANYEEIRMQGESSSPYIYQVFYDPQRYVYDTLTYYPPTYEGFVHVQRAGKVHYESIDWSKAVKEQKNILYILEEKELSGEMQKDPRFKIQKTLQQSPSEKVWYIISFTPEL